VGFLCSAAASEVPQVWCLYTEMLDYWEEGLTAPDDITILWPDDNVSLFARQTRRALKC
jgi:hypothetical protein